MAGITRRLVRERQPHGCNWHACLVRLSGPPPSDEPNIALEDPP